MNTSRFIVLAVVCLALTFFSEARADDQTREIQSLLVRSDRNPGPIDGAWGRRTEAALVDFLAEHGRTFEGELSVEILDLLRSAPEGPDFVRRELKIPNTMTKRMRGNRDQPENERQKIYKSWDIPQYTNPNPNLATLRFYLRRQLNDAWGFGQVAVTPNGAPSPFEFKIEKSRILTAEMNHSALLSYLYYEDGAIVYDEITPHSRFGDIVNNNTGLRSNSVGKSMVSYVLGHAICEGHIAGLDARLDDWPLIQNTVYENQRLIDLVNMRAGDDRVVDDVKGLISSGRWYNIFSVGEFARKELAGTKPRGREGKRAYHYNGLATNIVLNYVIHKSRASLNALMDKIFNEKAGVEKKVYFFVNNGYQDDDGAAWYQFYASRYDYLRIARAMLNDWQNETCVGRYLKEVHDRSQRKRHHNPDPMEKFESGRSYGGFFHTNYPGMGDRAVLGMDGYGGQAIMIDFDNGRIVSANSVHIDYDWYQLVHQVIQNGRLP